MYLRHTTLRKDGKVRRYWRLVRSVRIGRRVVQQTVAHLGELDEAGRIEARALAQHLIGTPERAAPPATPPHFQAVSGGAAGRYAGRRRREGTGVLGRPR
jgi:hypothetical protein